MNRRSAIRHLVVAGAGPLLADACAPVLAGALAPGQPVDSSDDEPQNFVIRSEVRLVLLDVSVKNRRGEFAPGLSKDDFSVLENGRRQQITVFDDEDRPVTVGILVDESRSMTSKRADTLAAAEIFVEQSNPNDEMFVLNFNDHVKPGLPAGTLFSDDTLQLRSALLRGIPEGKTALNDAIAAGLKQLELGKRDKKTLVLISDGGDNASQHKRSEVLDMVERSTATIYAIGLFAADDPDLDPGILRRLAKVSGGEAYFPQSTSEMTPVCRAIAKEIRTRYTIGYVPVEGVSALRHIQVVAASPRHERLLTRTRSSYQYDQIQSNKRDEHTTER